jgi:hypothetical protein
LAVIVMQIARNPPAFLFLSGKEFRHEILELHPVRFQL